MSNIRNPGKSNEPDHVHFVQRRKAEILARKNQEKMGFSPTELLHYANNDGSFLERFNKMMERQSTDQSGMNQKQNQYRQPNRSADIKQPFMSKPEVKPFDLRPLRNEAVASLMPSHPVFDGNSDYAVDGKHNGQNRRDETGKRKWRDHFNEFKSSDVNETSSVPDAHNDNDPSPCKIQRFSAGELAKLIHIPKTESDPRQAKEQLDREVERKKPREESKPSRDRYEKPSERDGHSKERYEKPSGRDGKSRERNKGKPRNKSEDKPMGLMDNHIPLPSLGKQDELGNQAQTSKQTNQGEDVPLKSILKNKSEGKSEVYTQNLVDPYRKSIETKAPLKSILKNRNEIQPSNQVKQLQHDDNKNKVEHRNEVNSNNSTIPLLDIKIDESKIDDISNASKYSNYKKQSSKVTEEQDPYSNYKKKVVSKPVIAVVMETANEIRKEKKLKGKQKSKNRKDDLDTNLYEPKDKLVDVNDDMNKNENPNKVEDEIKEMNDCISDKWEEANTASAVDTPSDESYQEQRIVDLDVDDEPFYTINYSTKCKELCLLEIVPQFNFRYIKGKPKEIFEMVTSKSQMFYHKGACSWVAKKVKSS